MFRINRAKIYFCYYIVKYLFSLQSEAFKVKTKKEVRHVEKKSFS